MNKENKNSDLTAARVAKNDEFYTQLEDIELEISAYLEFDPDLFRDKTLLLPADDPEWSNFTRYFVERFSELGLKKLISTSYTPFGTSSSDDFLFDYFDAIGTPEDEREETAGRILVLERGDYPEGSRIDFDTLSGGYLKGDGDFRSPEVTAFRDEADIVITNPPFSLFREFIPWIDEGRVQFSILGNMNAVVCKEVSTMIRDKRLWYGPTISSGDREFRVPDDYPLLSEGSRTDEDGNNYIRVKGVRWFTNIDHGKRHEPLELMTLEENLLYSRKEKIREEGYPKFDHYDAIEVSFTESIPRDYTESRKVTEEEVARFREQGFIVKELGRTKKGKVKVEVLNPVMAVPITFLDKYNPEQFEILEVSNRYGIFDTWGKNEEIREMRSHGNNINGEATYNRIHIRRVL